MSRPSVAAPDPVAEVHAAVRLFGEGKAVTARRRLDAVLADPGFTGAGPRTEVLRVLLDICLHGDDADCVASRAPDFAAAAEHAPVANDVQRARLALEAVYYLDEARWRTGMAPDAILAGPIWKTQLAADGDLYLRRQVLASNLLLAQGRRSELDRSLDRILSLVASLKNPQDSRLTVASSLADVIATLMQAGETERAWGLYRAAGAQITRALPELSLDQAVWQLNSAKLLQQMGDAAGARLCLDATLLLLDRIEAPGQTLARLGAEAMTLQIVMSTIAGDKAAAQAAIARHPFAGLYRDAGRTPASPEEAAYLAARALAAAAANVPDPVAAQALRRRVAYATDPDTAARTAGYRAAGEALALPPGAGRAAQLQELGRRLREVAAGLDQAGVLSRNDLIDRILLSLALTQADVARTPEDRDVVFTLFQLAPRNGTSFDADALAALGQARDEVQRRTVHQALRLTARRDRLERARIQKVAAAMLGPGSGATLLAHDLDTRAALRDEDEAIAAAGTELARAGLSLRGRRLVKLAQLQAVLAPDEAALAVAPTMGGFAYMCVRRDRTEQTTGAVDVARLRLDAKLLQAALTAGYAPSEELDAQFPAAAAVRLYGALVKPFETCLKPGDRILWLGDVAYAGAPLAVLLPGPPPRSGAGYDLAAAEWLVRRHAISYAGSAAALVSLRAPGARPQADLDFLGVGDPRLDGVTASGEARAGGRFGGLSALPETRAELKASAEGFRDARLLLGEDATERAVRSEVVGAYRYLSFATHGLLREDLQGLSDPALVLTPQSAADSADDGLLTASEIADLNLHAAFVALSACNTANFEFDRIAQDLPALASAFALSGVPATLGTLWPVDSQTGQAVVAATFAGLRRGEAPGDALARAQRAFLAAPPGRAYLHPRFWAPFVVLGDGGAAPAPQAAEGALSLRRVEMAPDAGEVIGLVHAPGGVAARFIGEADASGRHGEGVRLTDASGAELWRAADHEGGASATLAVLDGRLLTSGYVHTARGPIAPVLELRAPDGALVRRWTGEASGALDAFVFAGAARGRSRVLVAVADLDLHGAADVDGGLHVLEVGADLAPRTLFDIAPPPGTRLSDATLLVLGDRLLVTYSDMTTTYDASAAVPLDDYDAYVCRRDRITWVELRDLATGARLAQRTLEGVSVSRAAIDPRGGVLLAGARREGCAGEAKAVVLALDAKLAARTVYADDSLGFSSVRVLEPLPGGRMLAAAIKADVMDAAQARPAGPDAGAPANPGRLHATLAVVLDEAGRPSAPKLLDAGVDLLPSAAVAVGDEVLLGGSLGGRGALFHLAQPR
jgi:CHAT domain-containing protein